ncbi:unnamed protein product [Ceutorhynchus assimilis]|uniref:Uncharacterized protein n=1 Tax=Ceutorhynchus assimilis TaxID=467358 RepID=A0A9N9MDG2_9CUCU|nr:unnamed protein product [Ceutorhynchus assimilis]
MFKSCLIIALWLFACLTLTNCAYDIITNYNSSNQYVLCYHFESGSSRICKTFDNFTAVREFMLTSHVKVEIHEQVFPKIYKFYFARLKHTKELVIWNCGLHDIEPGAFYGSLSVLKIDFQRNKLEIIKEGVFNDLLITHLNLAFNRIQTIEPEALSYMQNIEEINLLSNRISRYNWKWFNKTPLLKSLYFQNNTIKEVPERAFRHLIDKRHAVNIFFSFNEIRFIHPLAFDDMDSTTVGKLYLDHNLLETWNEALSMHINELKISFNNIKCIDGDLRGSIKNNSLRNFIENPYNCQCLKEIKSIGDCRREISDWFLDKYLQCRKNGKAGQDDKKDILNPNIKIFSSP